MQAQSLRDVHVNYNVRGPISCFKKIENPCSILPGPQQYRCVANIKFLLSNFLVRSSIEPYAAASPFSHFQVCSSEELYAAVQNPSPWRSDEYFEPYKYSHGFSFFPPHDFWPPFPLPLSFLLLCLQISIPQSTTMAPRKSTPAKRQRSDFTSRATPPPPEDPHRFISREVERIYHESLFNRSFISERSFRTSNAFFNFTIQNRG